jgi:hypothetical protein
LFIWGGGRDMGGYTGGYIPIDKKSVRNSKPNYWSAKTITLGLLRP